MDMMNVVLRRRRFLRHMLLSGAGFTVLRVADSAWTAQANEKLNIALIGVGGRGEWFTSAIPRSQNLVALCDVDENKNPDAVWDKVDAEAVKKQYDLLGVFKNGPRFFTNPVGMCTPKVPLRYTEYSPPT